MNGVDDFLRLQSLIAEGLLVLAPDGVVRHFNDAASRLLHLQPSDRGSVLWDIQPALRGTLLRERLGRCVATGKTERLSAELPPSTWLEIALHPVGPDEVWLLATDVTRRYEAERDVHGTEERMRRLDERFQVALESAQMAVWETDLLTGQVFRSEGHDRLYGYPEPLPTWTHEMFLASLHPEDRPSVEEQVAMIFTGKVDSYDSTFRTRWPDGSWHWLTSRARVQRSTDGRAVVVRGVLLDITALKEAELQLHEAVRTRDHFLSLASHELRTPLTALRLQLQLLRRSKAAVRDPERIVAELVVRVDSAERQLKRLTSLIDNLLDVARIQSNKLDFQPAPGDLAPVIREVHGRFSEEAGQRGIAVTLDCAPQLPAHFDRLRMEQVLDNLLGNALRYGAGSTIHIRAHVCGGRLRIEVEDGGPGVRAEDRERIFQRFERGSAPTRNGGLGLGLYIVRQIVETHDGRVWVEPLSEPNRGSRFVIELPVREEIVRASVG